MEGLNWGAVVAVVALCCSLCSIAAFFLGRRKAAQEEGKEEGSLKTDIQYIKDTIRDTTKSLDALSLKLDTQDKQREEDYRQMLIQITDLKSSYKSLHIRVDEMNKRIDEHYHH